MQAYIRSIEPVSVEWTKNICLKIFFAGCDFKCPYCNTPELLETKEAFIKELKDVKKEISLNSGFAEAVIFTGGEPCLQRPQLVELAKFCKNNKLKTGLETNASKPEVLYSLLKNSLIDFISIDLKSPLREDIFEKVTKSGTFFITTNQLMQNIKAGIEMLYNYKDKVDIEVKTLIVPSLLFKKEDIVEIASLVDYLDARWILQRFNNEQDLVDKNFRHINPPSISFLEDLKESCLRKYPQLRIEIK